MGAFIAAIVAVRILVPAGWDPSILVSFGEEAEATLSYGRRMLGDVQARPALGHDGKFFFIQANDPFLLDPDENASILDRPTYRSQRMLYPLLASGFGLLPPWGVVWGMLAINVLALGVGTWGAAELARRMGGSGWWGLAFGLNVGLISELSVGGAGAIGFAFGVWGLVVLSAGKRWAAVVLFCLAALSREVLLLIPFGAALWSWRNERPWLALVIGPALSVASWGLYVRSRLGWSTGVEDVQEIGWPFQGFVSAVSNSREGWLNPIFAALLLVICILFVLRVVSRGTLVGWATVGFALLAMLLTRQVWLSYFDISRAVAPALTGYFLVAFADRGHAPSGERDLVEPPVP